MSRVLKINRALLAEAVNKGKTLFAKNVGIHLTTLNALLDDSWDRIERDTIERLCDHLDCNVSDLFTLVPDLFWQPFIEASSYRIMRGVVVERRVKLMLEEQAKTSIAGFLQGRLPQVTGGFADSITDQDEIVEFARTNNCIVIGTHQSNLACEVLLSRHFGAKPFDSRPENRARVPFRLVQPASRRRSAFIQPAASESGETELGIYSEQLQDMVVRMHRHPPEEYFKARIRNGPDGAIVLVVNRPFGAKKNVKLIVLGGFSRIGTLAASLALARDYRNLEPLPESPHTLGVLEARFDKTTDGDDRQVVGFKWVYLEGGRKTIPLEHPSP